MSSVLSLEVAHPMYLQVIRLIAISWLLLVALPAQAQSQIQLTGLAFFDYAYTFASPDEEEEGDNGFDYRRIYLTTNYVLSDDFSGRFRLEVKSRDATPFVKDAYLRWHDPWGDGHELVIGVSPPPAFTVSERFWGYRSLEATIMDRNDIVDSRDFGVAARGRLDGAGAVRYGVMVANNNNLLEDDDAYKRAYGQLEWYPVEALTLTLGGDYAGYGDERTGAVTLNAFAGLQRGNLRVGAEGFWQQTSLDADLADSGSRDEVQSGLSVFSRFEASARWELVARLDYVEREMEEVTSETFAIAGFAFRPHPNVRFIPNLLLSKDNRDAEARATGRITLHVNFP